MYIKISINLLHIIAELKKKNVNQKLLEKEEFRFSKLMDRYTKILFFHKLNIYVAYL